MPYAGRRGCATRRCDRRRDWSRIVLHDLMKVLLFFLGHDFSSLGSCLFVAVS